MSSYLRTDIGIVAIGRNEGERLRRCLQSIPAGLPVVYADSGSSDGSALLARELGAEVVELDPASPFTAARGRNEGFGRLRAYAPGLTYVQFVDGDCEFIDGWLNAAAGHLDTHVDVAAVCGRLREKHPEQSVYNRLCDAEWNRAPGEVLAVGGIAMFRVDAFEDVQGFRTDVPAGEEPELCRRLREAGWRIHRLATPMAWHDAAMTKFSQWWKRSRRTGFGFAQALAMQKPREAHDVRAAASAWIWALVMPLAISLAAWFGHPAALAALAVYPLQIIRQARRASGPWRVRLERGLFLVLGRWPEWQGQIDWALSAGRGKAVGTRFDYKSPGRPRQ